MSYDDDMCPNCCTPWKCNGPHTFDPVELAAVDEAYDLLGEHLATSEAQRLWLDSPRHAFGGLTPQQMVDAGRAREVVTYLRMLHARAAASRSNT